MTVLLKETTPPPPWYRQPRWIMLRSVVVPGWGQWTNRKHLKAVVVAAGEGYLGWRAIDWRNKEKEAKKRLAENRDDPDLESRYQLQVNHAGSRRRDFTWWTIFAAVVSMGDAYVDAKLGRNFDAEFKPQDQAAGPGGRPGGAWQLGLALKLP